MLRPPYFLFLLSDLAEDGIWKIVPRVRLKKSNRRDLRQVPSRGICVNKKGKFWSVGLGWPSPVWAGPDRAKTLLCRYLKAGCKTAQHRLYFGSMHSTHTHTHTHIYISYVYIYIYIYIYIYTVYRLYYICCIYCILPAAWFRFVCPGIILYILFLFCLELYDKVFL
jgi:hypothetical protein